VEGDAGAECAPIKTFEELDVLPAYVLQALAEREISAPMPIQAQALPLILGGHDLVGIARTGSGKTLAFLMPAIVHIEAQEPLQRGRATPIALVLAPTRELAVQICEEAEKLLGRSKEGRHADGVRAACAYGGLPKPEQLKALRWGCHVLVATPGRLADLLEQQEVSLSRVTYFVLDEADRMLDYGFQGELDRIAGAVRPDRHMLFFSATWPREVQDLAKALCQGGQQPVRLAVGQGDDGVVATRADIVQQVEVFDQETWEERDAAKRNFLYAHVRKVLKKKENKALVFVNSKALADEMRDTLWKEGFKADSMHGGRPQQTRLNVLDSFRRGEMRLLVATDVMGRGLDIPDISHVVVFDMGDVEDYVHRIGRTARGLSERGGHSLTLFEYNSRWPEIAGELVGVLKEAAQEVPEGLQAIADEVAAGRRPVDARATRSAESGGAWGSGGWKANGQQANGWKGRGH